MRPMRNDNTPEGKNTSDMSAFDLSGDRKVVYVRAIAASDVMPDLQEEFGELDVTVADDAIIYSVHDEDGERLALVGDRELAFAAARQHELTPVSVH